MEHLGKLVRVRRIHGVQGQVAHIEFEDSSVRAVDLVPLMHGPIFDELLENQGLFHQMIIIGGTLAWPNGADIDPDVLYYGLTPAATGETAPVY